MVRAIFGQNDFSLGDLKRSVQASDIAVIDIFNQARTLAQNSRNDRARWDLAEQRYKELSLKCATEQNAMGDRKLYSIAADAAMLGISILAGTAGEAGRVAVQAGEAGYKGIQNFIQYRDTYNNSRAGEFRDLVGLKNTELQERLNKNPDGIADLCKQVMGELTQLYKSASSAN